MPITARAGNSSASVFERDAVVRVVEGRHEHHAVGDVEVGVAGRQPLAVHRHRPRERQRHDCAAGRRRLRPASLAGGGGCPSSGDGSRRPDPAPRRARPCPRSRSARRRRRARACRRRRSPRRARSCCVRRATRRRRARSRRASARGCGPGRRSSSHSSVTSSSPCAVDLDAAAFEHEAAVRRPALRDDARQAGEARDRARRRARPAASCRTSPSALNAQSRAPRRRCVDDARWRRIAQPDAVGRHDVQAARGRSRTPCAASAGQRRVARRLATRTGSRRVRVRRAPGRSPRTPTGSARTCPASRARGAASRSRWRGAAPIRQAARAAGSRCPGVVGRKLRRDRASRRDCGIDRLTGCPGSGSGSARRRRRAGRAGRASCGGPSR